MRVYIIFIGLLLPRLIWAQVSLLTIESPDSLGFQLAVNGSNVTDSTVIHWSSEFEAGKDILLDLLVETDSTRHLSATINLDSQKHLTLQVTALKTTIALLEYATVRYEPQPFEITSALDTISPDSIFVETTLPGVCNIELNPQKLKFILTVMDSQFLDRQRMNTISREMKGCCLTVFQLKQLAAYIDFEDSRLTMCQDIYPQILDKALFRELRSLFILAAHIELFDQFIQMQGP